MDDCRFIEVSKENSESNPQNGDFPTPIGIIGLYERTDDKTSDPTRSTTWKHPNEDRIIYNKKIIISGSPPGVGFKPTTTIRYIWRLGKNTGNYYYKGTFPYVYFHSNVCVLV